MSVDRMTVKTGAKRGAKIGACIVLVTGLLMLLWLGGASASWGISAKGSEWLLLPALAGLLSVPVGIVLLFPQRTRARGCAIVVGALMTVVPMPFVARGVSHVRKSGLRSFTERSQPLIDAIRAYESDHRAPPETLTDLVPTFLPAVPDTGMGGAPKYRYARIDPAEHRGNTWMLRVPVPTAALSFDDVRYYPLENYDELGLPGPLEPLGGWVYVTD